MRHLHMKQQTLAVAKDQNAQYEQYRRPTKRDVFLATMDKIVPWGALCAVRCDRASLPEGWQRSSACRAGTHAADVFRAALVQLGRRRVRGRTAGQYGAAPLRGHRPGA